MDDKINLCFGKRDSEMIEYSCVCVYLYDGSKKRYMLYNGNSYGKDRSPDLLYYLIDIKTV